MLVPLPLQQSAHFRGIEGRPAPERRPVARQMSPVDLARNALIEANAGLVPWSFNYLRNQAWFRARLRGVLHEDVMAAGQLGLIWAAERFDPTRGRFSTIAFIAIRHRMLRFLFLERREKAGQFGVNDEGLSLLDETPARETAQGLEADDRERAQAALDGLPERERDILRRRIVEGETLAVVAAAVGTSNERVRQIEARALRLLAKSMAALGLDDALR